MKIKYSVDHLKRSISGFAGKPSTILVFKRHTPNPSSKFTDPDIETPFTKGTLAKIESHLYLRHRQGPWGASEAGHCHSFREGGVTEGIIKTRAISSGDLAGDFDSFSNANNRA